MTPADKLRAAALHEVGSDYVWGDEGTGGVEGDDDYDCSGFCWAMWRIAGITIPRETAHDYYLRGTRVGRRPLRVGDYFVLLNHEAHAHHIGLYVGHGETVEAKSRRTGVVKSTVSAVNDRGAIWMRLPGVNLGELTPTPPVVPPRPVLRFGDRGGTVKLLQSALRRVGYVKLVADGEFGPVTRRVVRHYQARHFIVPSGVVNARTWRALGY